MKVGLTGGVASGKSTVSEILRELGAVVIDSDQIAREVVARGTPGLAQVVAEFGPEYLTSEGDLDRPKMAALVFNDEPARRRLEAITHPLINEVGRAREADAEAAGKLVVNDMPLIAEMGIAELFDVVIVVDVPVEEALRRMVEDRGWTREDAEARIAAQASREARRAIATYVIDNSGSREHLREQVERLYAELVAGRP
ncbi:MAG TPA: dephospho-CoA kinase [Nocardioidaceae bacterium]|nr:dephospho-CoA kinase [Nocardioidaceae bacterium]